MFHACCHLVVTMLAALLEIAGFGTVCILYSSTISTFNLVNAQKITVKYLVIQRQNDFVQDRCSHPQNL